MDKHRTILVVDDDHDALEAISQVISRSGIECFTASSGPEGLTVLRDRQVQAVISDHDMPGMDGVDFLKLVATRYPHVCRILLTARRDAEPAVRAINGGQVYRFLNKPCRAADLLTTLHFAFEASDHEMEVRRLGAQLRRAELVLNEVRRKVPGIVEEIEGGQPPLAV